MATKERATLEVDSMNVGQRAVAFIEFRRLPAAGLRQKNEAPVAAEGAGDVSPGGCVAASQFILAGESANI